MLPWEQENEYGSRFGISPRYTNQTYRYVRERVPDSKRLYLRKGDIVKFDFCRMKPWQTHWKDWFMTKEDFRQSWRKNPNIPFYASEQFAIIAGNYRIVKFKYATFSDYGRILMMLTGDKKGYIRNYYCVRPFNKVFQFGHKIESKKLQRKFPDYVVDIYNDDYEYSEAGRELLLLKLNSALNRVPF